MEKGKMNKIYYVLLMLLVLVSLWLIVILIRRANQADKFFEHQKSQQEELSYEGS